MATATEMTLALGRTVYGGDPGEEAESNERIEGRETRVSVTWRLSEYEQNLPLMASMLAEEAERALGAADRSVRRQSPTEAELERPNESVNERLPAQKLTPSVGTGVALEFVGPNAIGTNGTGANGYGPSRSPYPPAYVPAITKAQRLAIQSLCTRHGIPDWELRRLVWERFGKKEQGELNKEQAGELLEALQQGSLKDESRKDDLAAGRANGSAYAN